MEKSALNINKGIEQPDVINENSIQRFLQKKRQIMPVEYYIEGILSGNRTILSQAITLVESTNVEHQKIAQQIIEKSLPYSGNSIRIGITGVPGVGKSSFIETLGSFITQIGHKLAVLAIDPSSERSKGSILGDKTRMEELSRNVNAFIRPTPSTGSLGGVARKTRESMILCEAAGFNVIFIETVGVGQSETTVHSMVDFFLLLMLAGAGDELQGIKRGIMEMADSIVITKADGQNIEKANRAMAEYRNALHLFPPTDSGWIPKVSACSSLENTGIELIWQTIDSYFSHIKNNGFLFKKRNEQSKFWMYETINNKLYQDFYEDKIKKKRIKEMEELVLAGKMSSFQAAQKLFEDI
jgi:LAO/AO transport system kinase